MTMPTDRDAYNVVCLALGLPKDSSPVKVCDEIKRLKEYEWMYKQLLK